jgi:hypothetical protein
LKSKRRLTGIGARSAAGVSLTTALGAIVPEKLKHLSAHPAMDAQSLDDFFSQGLAWGQQSTGMALRDMPVASARAIPPATGSIATDIAMRATKMARKVLMAQTGLSAEPLSVKLSDCDLVAADLDLVDKL